MSVITYSHSIHHLQLGMVLSSISMLPGTSGPRIEVEPAEFICSWATPRYQNLKRKCGLSNCAVSFPQKQPSVFFWHVFSMLTQVVSLCCVSMKLTVILSNLVPWHEYDRKSIQPIVSGNNKSSCNIKLFYWVFLLSTESPSCLFTNSMIYFI